MSEPSSSGSGSSDSWSGSSSDSGWSSHDAGSSAGTPPPASEVPPLFTQQSSSEGYPASGAPYSQPSYGQPSYAQTSYGQPTYGAPGYGQAPYGGMPYAGMPYGGMPYGGMPYGSPYGRPPENNLVWAIVSIVFSLVMCSWFATPIGIVAAVKSAQVDTLWAQGQFQAAQQAAKSARTLSIWCLAVSVLLALLWIFLVFVAPFVFLGAVA